MYHVPPRFRALSETACLQSEEIQYADDLFQPPSFDTIARFLRHRRAREDALPARQTQILLSHRPPDELTT